MRITLPCGAPAELAMPTAGDARHAVVIAPDIFGLRPLYDHLTQRLADEWHAVVCAVEPFPGHDLPQELEPRWAAVHDIVDDDHLTGLLDGAEATGFDTVGLLGFCMGGMYSFKAARSDRFHRIAAFYGMIRLPEAWRGDNHAEPLDIVLNHNADRVLAIIGGVDTFTPPADVDALAETGATVVIYPEAGHGFAHDASRPTHRAADAADAFARATEWLIRPID